MWPFFHFLPSNVDHSCVPQVPKLRRLSSGTLNIQTTFLLGNLALHMAQILMRAAYMVVQLQKNKKVESLPLCKPLTYHIQMLRSQNSFDFSLGKGPNQQI